MNGYWDWMEAYEREAVAERDPERLRLARIRSEAYGFRETNPAQAIALYQEGEHLAQRLGHPWWTLYYRQWQVHATMHFLRDYRHILNDAVQNTLEARKPQYDEFPQRVSVYEDLAAAYMGIDAEGYEEPIRQTLDAVERMLTPALESRRHSLESQRRDLALELDRNDEARACGLRGLALVDRDGRSWTALHYSVFVYCSLCQVAYRQGNWEALAEWSHQGESPARQVGHQMELSELLLWQTVLARRDKEEDRAQRWYRRLLTRIGQLHMPPTPAFYEALHAYHELAGEFDRLCTLTRQELRAIQNKGRLHYETRVRIKLCRLLARLSEPITEELESARQAARQLKKPERHLRELEDLARSR